MTAGTGSAAANPGPSLAPPVGPRRARVYESLRSAHLERFPTMVPAVTIYRGRRYDFDPAVLGDTPVLRLGRAGTVWHLFRGGYAAVELNEPLMASRWLDLAAQLAAIRLADALRHRRTVVSAYCISLTDPSQRLARRRLPAAVAGWWARTVLGVLVRRYDRLAFGTEASRELLGRYVDESAVAPRAAVFPAVATPCDCASTGARDEATVLFLGAFSDRKGIRQLMAAWDALPSGHGLRLRLLGSGPLLPEVQSWAAGRGEVELVVDAPRAVVHAALRGAHVLVLLSQRIGAWREQVGLPIVEGLAHGCEVVATPETGLSPWLKDHGHTLVRTGAESGEVAAALLAAARSPRTPADICTDLPAADPRREADSWMMAVAGPPPTLPESAAEERRSGHRRERARLYVQSARRSHRRYGTAPLDLVRRWDDRPVFVVGSPRSGTSFTAASVGAVAGFADLGELRPLKRAIPELVLLPTEAAAARIRATVHRAQRLGLVAARRGIEQTPESTYLIDAIARAFPAARFVHLVRDGRDVAASLVGLGWLAEAPDHDADEVGARFGAQARFWVEPERRAEFTRASEATRAAWVWRRYETTARTQLEPLGDRTLEIRYEDLVGEPNTVARRLATFLDAVDRAGEFEMAFRRTRGSASGRWRRDLGASQLADVEREAGPLLAELGYTG